DDRNAPAAVGAGAKDGEGVVADGDALGEAPRGRGGLHRLLLGREVDTGEVELSDLRDGAVAVWQAGLGDRLCEEVAENCEAAVDAEVVRRALWPADEREDLAVGADERQVGLRVAAVDREDERLGHAVTSRDSNCGRCSRPAARRLSVSSSTCGTWPMSGCARS